MPKFATRSWQAREALTNRAPFTTYGALSATRHGAGDFRPHLPANNRLPHEWRKRWEADVDRIAYVVWSYDTPIAWVTMYGDVVKVAHKWSATTTQHQGMLYALDASPETRVGIADAAQRERQQERDKRAEARERAYTARMAARYGR